MDVLRHGAMAQLFGGVRAPSTLGIVPALVHLGQRPAAGGGAPGLPGRSWPAGRRCCPASDVLAFVDIDSQQKRVFGYHKQGAAFGYTKISGKSLMVRGLNVLAATISTPLAAPVIAAVRLRGGSAGLRPRRGVVHHRGHRRRPRHRVQRHDRGADGLGVLQPRSHLGCPPRRRVLLGHRAAELGRSRPRSPRSPPPPGRRSPIPGPCGMTSWAAGSPTPRSPRPNTPRSPSHRRRGQAPAPLTARLIVRRVRDMNTIHRHRPGRTVPGLALPRGLHRQPVRDAPGRRTPPRPRHHRADLRRLERRPAGPPALRLVPRQRRLAGLRRHQLQPATRRRRAGQPHLRQGPRRHRAPRPHRRRAPGRPPRPRSHHLAPATRLAPPAEWLNLFEAGCGPPATAA